MKKVIITTKGFSLLESLKAAYPAVYQSLVAQGLGGKIEVERTNPIIIARVEEARHRNPLTVKMNEMADKLDAINRTKAMVKADAMSKALTDKCLKVLKISKLQFLADFKGVMLRENPWQDFLQIFNPTLLPNDRYELQQQMETLSEFLKEHEEEVHTRLQLAQEINDLHIQHNFAPTGAAPYYFIEDGLRILEFDERFLAPQILGPDDCDNDGHMFRNNEGVQFVAFVNPSVVKMLLAEQNPDLMLDYIELIRRVDSHESGDLNQFPLLSAFLNANPII